MRVIVPLLLLVLLGCGGDSATELEILKQQQESLRELAKREKEILKLEKGLEQKQQANKERETELQRLEEEYETHMRDLREKEQAVQALLTEQRKQAEQLSNIQKSLDARAKLAEQRIPVLEEIAKSTTDHLVREHNASVEKADTIYQGAYRKYQGSPDSLRDLAQKETEEFWTTAFYIVDFETRWGGLIEHMGVNKVTEKDIPKIYARCMERFRQYPDILLIESDEAFKERAQDIMGHLIEEAGSVGLGVKPSGP